MFLSGDYQQLEAQKQQGLLLFEVQFVYMKLGEIILV